MWEDNAAILPAEPASLALHTINHVKPLLIREMFAIAIANRNMQHWLLTFG